MLHRIAAGVATKIGPWEVYSPAASVMIDVDQDTADLVIVSVDDSPVRIRYADADIVAFAREWFTDPPAEDRAD